MAFEAPNEPDVRKAAVAHVILNRKKSHRWGGTVKDVVMKPWQFEPWMTRRKEIGNLSPDDPRYRKAGQIADAVLAGALPEPTSGATHFLNPTVVRQRRGGSLPLWARGEGISIGRHTFYSVVEGRARPAGREAERQGQRVLPSRARYAPTRVRQEGHGALQERRAH
jgi:N-acetylmuramoyl-L-alanine amidase